MPVRRTRGVHANADEPRNDDTGMDASDQSATRLLACAASQRRQLVRQHGSRTAEKGGIETKADVAARPHGRARH